MVAPLLTLFQAWGVLGMAEFSGPQWCERFPGSTSVEDLEPEWRGKVWAFISALQKGGAAVHVEATLRPRPRAYLMHYCWMITHLSQAPSAIPPLGGVAIDWTHGGDHKAARTAAAAMVKTFGLQVLPSLESRHIAGRAIDMAISWSGRLSIRDFDGILHYIMQGANDGTNPELAKVGASFGVHKLADDLPHWSDDGH
jgi:hypothetical protein